MTYLTQDWRANTGNFRIQWLLLWFRAAQMARRAPQPLRLVLLPVRVIYQWMMESAGLELFPPTRVGPGLKIVHGQALVVNAETVLGANCTLRNSVTIGNKAGANGARTACPTFGNGVDIGANAVIIGPLNIGDNAVIGAGSVVVKDVPADAIVAGNPARVIRMRA
jgi:putative colanic acid biosynthesis acetyltransferase WcaB